MSTRLPKPGRKGPGAPGARAIPPAAGYPKKRTCLRCRRTFRATHHGNHLCPNCRSTIRNGAP